MKIPKWAALCREWMERHFQITGCCSLKEDRLLFVQSSTYFGIFSQRHKAVTYVSVRLQSEDCKSWLVVTDFLYIIAITYFGNKTFQFELFLKKFILLLLFLFKISCLFCSIFKFCPVIMRHFKQFRKIRVQWEQMDFLASIV